MWLGFVEGESHHWWGKWMSLVNDVIVWSWGERKVCLGKGWSSVLDPMDKIPQDETKTKSKHSDCLFPCDSCQNQNLAKNSNCGKNVGGNSDKTSNQPVAAKTVTINWWWQRTAFAVTKNSNGNLGGILVSFKPQQKWKTIHLGEVGWCRGWMYVSNTSKKWKIIQSEEAALVFANPVNDAMQASSIRNGR